MPEIVGTLKPPRLASAPSTPALGQLYFDTTSGTLRTWNGTAWAPLGLPADIVVAAATRILANKLLVGDAQPAFRIMGDGTIEWGPGGGTAPNLSLSRYGSSSLAFLAGLAVRHDWGIWTEGSTPAASAAFAHYAPGSDAQPRVQIAGDGTLKWGPGGGTVPDTNIYRYAPGYLATDGQLYFRGGTNAYLAFARPGEQARFFIGPDGNLNWGSGAGAQDVNLYRYAADFLKTDDNLTVMGAITIGGEFYRNDAKFFIDSGGGLAWGPGDWSRDVSLYRAAANLLQTDDDFYTSLALRAAGRVVAAENLAGQVRMGWNTATPIIEFGTAADVNLYRAAANLLKTDDAFQVGLAQPLIVNNGGSAGVPSVQAELAWAGMDRGYRHWIGTAHDGGAAINNFIDFNIWTPADSSGSTIGSKRVLRLRGDGALVFADGTVQTTAGGGGGVDYENDWSAATAYIPGDVVRYGGQHWIAVNPGTNQVPGAAADAGFGTAFPTTPVDGMEFTLVDSLTAPTYAWRFRYVASITDAYKWVFVGGSPMHAEASASQSTTSTSFVDLTGGPSLVLPRTGIYEVEFGDSQQTNQDGTSVISSVAATGLSPSDQLAIYTASAPPVNGARRFITAAAISGTLKMQYRVTAQTGTYFNRWLSARPVRVS